MKRMGTKKKRGKEKSPSVSTDLNPSTSTQISTSEEVSLSTNQRASIARASQSRISEESSPTHSSIVSTRSSNVNDDLGMGIFNSPIARQIGMSIDLSLSLSLSLSLNLAGLNRFSRNRIFSKSSLPVQLRYFCHFCHICHFSE